MYSPNTNKMNSKETRREFLVEGTVALALLGCDLREEKKPTLRELLPQVKTYYPEIADMPVESSGSFSTAQTHTQWFNLTKLPIDVNFYKNTFIFFEEFSTNLKVPNLKIYDYLLNNQVTSFVLTPDKTKERIIFFLSENTPQPNWAGEGTPRAGTSRRFDKHLIFVKLYSNGQNLPPSSAFTTPILVNNSAVAIEACQSAIRVLTTTDIGNIAQEITCNSLGRAYVLRQNGWNYTEYEKYSRLLTFGPPTGKSNYPAIVLTKEEYEQIPIIQNEKK